MSTKKTAQVVESDNGVVRFQGLASTFKVRSASGAEYVFRKMETTEVPFIDWGWLQQLADNRHRFDFLKEPVAPQDEVPTATVVVPDATKEAPLSVLPEPAKN